MFQISRNQIVTMNRGDTAEMYLYINLGTELAPYWWHMGKYDKLYFALMEPNQEFEHAIYKRVFSQEDEVDLKGEIPYVVLRFESPDTENLLAGAYYYTIKLVRNSSASDPSPVVDTIVPKKKFILID